MFPKPAFSVVIERDEDGWFIAEVPELQGCHTQGKTKKEVLENIKEAIALFLEVRPSEKPSRKKSSFVSVERVRVNA